MCAGKLISIRLEKLIKRNYGKQIINTKLYDEICFSESRYYVYFSMKKIVNKAVLSFLEKGYRVREKPAL